MRLSVLDSFRGLFASMIVLLHGPFQGYLFYTSFIRNSAVFVDFFFILSGFVISLAYSDRVRDGTTLLSFMIRRVGRLWPLHAFILTLFIVILLAKALAAKFDLFNAELNYTSSEITRFIIENFALVHAFRNETVYWLNFPSWSISAELWAYIAFGLLCLMPRLLPMNAIAVIVVTGAIVLLQFDPGFGHFFNEGLFRGIGNFFVGYFCYQFYKRFQHCILPSPNLLEIVVIAFVFVHVAYADNPLFASLLPITFAVTILVFSYESGIISTLLKTAFFRTIGTRSYSIYLVHAFVYAVLGLIVRLVERIFDLTLYSENLVNPANNQLLDFGSPLFMDALMLAMVALVITLSGFTWRFIEMPGQRMAKRIAQRIESGRDTRVD